MMPTLPVETMVARCNNLEGWIVRAAFNGCRLRAIKPFRCIDCADHSGKALAQACANYVWRMLCFDYVSYLPHNICAGASADYDVRRYFYEKFGCVVFADKTSYGDCANKTICVWTY